MSLRARILLLVAVATLAPALALVAHVFEERHKRIAAAEQGLSELALGAARELEQQVNGAVQLLHGLSRAREIEAGDRDACSRFLESVFAEFPQYTGIAAIRPNGDVHCDSRPGGRALNLADRGYFQRALASQRPVFDAGFGRMSGFGVLQVATAVRGGDGRVNNVLFTALNLERFVANVARHQPYPNTAVTLWDREGVILATAPQAGPERLAGKAFRDSEFFRWVGSARDGAAVELPGPLGIPRIWALSSAPLAAGCLRRVSRPPC